MSDKTGVMVFAEQEGGKIHPVVYELLGKGRELAAGTGGETTCVLLGHQVEEAANELIYHGADKVYLYDAADFEDFDLLNYKHNVVALTKEIEPEVFLLGATHMGRTLGPRIAAALGTGLTADCTGLSIGEDGDLIQQHPTSIGNTLAHIKTRTRPQMATVRYKVMAKAERDTGRTGEIIKKEPEMIPSLLTILGKEASGEVNITGADVIVSGGRGLKSAEDFSLLEKLAGLFGGVVGSSRPLVDDGWISRDHQVGLSGSTVSPKLYIACGISGSVQHMAGMSDSGTIVAINTDPSAPIFKIADYGIVGDLYEVIPKLIDEIKEMTA